MLVERVQAGQGGPEKVFNAAAIAGETVGLSLSTLKRKCREPDRIGTEWESLGALPAQCESELVDFCMYMNRRLQQIKKQLIVS